MGARWRMAQAVIALTLSACGRIGFEPPATVDRDAAVDDGPRTADARPCAPDCVTSGGTCLDGACVVTVGLGESVTCPASGCVVDCTAPSTCTGGGTVTCPAGATCTFLCDRAGACTDLFFDCRGATCELLCTTANTCSELSFQCGQGGSCVRHCCDRDSCSDIVCPAGCDEDAVCP